MEPHQESHVADKRRDCRRSRAFCAARRPAMGLGEFGGRTGLSLSLEPLVLTTLFILRHCRLDWQYGGTATFFSPVLQWSKNMVLIGYYISRPTDDELHPCIGRIDPNAS